MRHAPLWLLLSLFAAVAGCADPNPTFVFDAAPVTRDAGAGGADGSAAETGGPEGGSDIDGGADGATDAPGDGR